MQREKGLVELSNGTRKEVVSALIFSIYDKKNPPKLVKKGYKEQKDKAGEKDGGHRDWIEKAFSQDDAVRAKAWADVGVKGKKEKKQVAALADIIGEDLALALYETMLEKVVHIKKHGATNHRY